MKSISKLALVLFCFVSACGGRSADDQSDHQTTSVGGAATTESTGGSSAESSTVSSTTGGSSAITSTTSVSTGGSSISSSTTGGSSAIVETTSLTGGSAPTGGAASVSTGGSSISSSTTGGSNPPSASNATGGSTPIAITSATGGSNSTGGATSVAATGGTNPTGGSNATGGATTAATTTCQPSVHVTYLRHTSASVLPGTNGFETLTVQYEAQCSDAEILTTTYSIQARNTKESYSTPYYTSDDKSNFVNIKLQQSGATIGGPLSSPKWVSANEYANLTFADSFTLKVGKPMIATVVLDIPTGFTSSVLDTQYTVYWNGLTARDANTYIVTSYADGFDGTNWPAFTVTSPLTVQVSPNTPASQIVLSTHDRNNEYLFSRYIVQNRGDKEIPFLTIDLQGSVTSLYSLSIWNCNTGNYVGTWSDDGTHLRENDTKKWTFGSIMWNIPAHDQIELCLKGSPATIDAPAQDNGNPKSGSLLNLRLTDAYTEDGVHAINVDPNSSEGCSSAGCVMAKMMAFKPSLMTLRKAKPIVSILPLPATTLVNGQNTLFTFKIAADNNGGQIQFAQFSVKHTKTERLSLSNFRVFKNSNELIVGTDVWIKYIAQSDGNSETYVTLNPTTINTDGFVYTLIGQVSNAQYGDTLLAQFRHRSSTLSVTRPICHPTGSDQLLLPDSSSICTASGPELIGQGSFLWSDMSDPETDEDWTDDTLVNDMSGSSVLTY